MAEKIYTIPINEAFDRYDGCPFCYLGNKLEAATLSYCLGASMMEPDVRVEMNQKGFCHIHSNALSDMKNKLGLALILESRLDELIKALEMPPSGGKKSLFSARNEGPDAAEALNMLSCSCYVCEKIKYTEGRYLSNAVYLWEENGKFRDKFVRQPFFCVTHFTGLLKAAKKEIKASSYAQLYDAAIKLEAGYFMKIREDIGKFCESFDHRNALKPLGDEKFSIERALKLLK